MNASASRRHENDYENQLFLRTASGDHVGYAEIADIRSYKFLSISAFAFMSAWNAKAEVPSQEPKWGASALLDSKSPTKPTLPLDNNLVSLSRQKIIASPKYGLGHT
jgi:hypothetical protein